MKTENATSLDATPAANQPRRCVVLGGTGYVGAAVVERLVAGGAEVAFSYHRQHQRADELAHRLGAQAFAFDAAVEQDGAVFDALWNGGDIDAIVQCIGTAGDSTLYREGNSGLDKLLATSVAEWNAMHTTTSTSTFVACRSLARRLRHGANVVLMGSIDGVKLVPAPLHYAAAKATVSGMARTLAKALGPQGVCVNMVAAGMLDGGIGRHLSADLRAQYLKHCSLKRLGQASEIAQTVAWLALCNSYVTGQSIILDGGL